VWGFLWVVVVRQTHFDSSLQLHPDLRTTDPIVDLPADAPESGLEPTEHLKWLESEPRRGSIEIPR